MRQPHALVIALVLGSGAPAIADTVSIQPSDDTVIMESSPENGFNFGGQRDAPIGTTGPMNGTTRSRGLFRFDVAATIPAGSTIDGATFQLTVQRTPPGSTTTNYELRRMLVSWIEGTQIDNDNPGGDLPAAGEPTWNRRAAPDTLWGANGAQQGTDYSSAVSASTAVVAGDAEGDTYSWTLNATGVADLQSMLDSPATNFGWIVLPDNESTPKSARRFYMKETLTDLPFRQGPPPELNIDFSPPPTVDPPEVTTFSLSGDEIALQFVATAGLTYEVQTNSGLEESGWSTFETFNPKSDGTLSSTIPSSALSRIFVRVLASDE